MEPINFSRHVLAFGLVIVLLLTLVLVASAVTRGEVEVRPGPVIVDPSGPIELDTLYILVPKDGTTRLAATGFRSRGPGAPPHWATGHRFARDGDPSHRSSRNSSGLSVSLRERLHSFVRRAGGSDGHAGFHTQRP